MSEINLEQDIPELDVEMEHAEHVTIDDAMDWYCVDGACDCELDEHGESTCPFITVEVCVDCMDEDGAGRDPGEWEDRPLRPWPHPESADSETGERR